MDHQFKVVLLGEGRVGKTSIVVRYVEGQFRDKMQSTVQASYLKKRLAIADEHISLALWDTAGQERFHALGPIYYRDAHGALLVYDLTDPGSLDRVRTWVKELRRMLGDDCALAIAGNKADLERNRQVDLDEAQSYAESVNAKHFVVSAKTGKGVEESFLQLTKLMLQRKKQGHGGGGGKKRRKVMVEDDPNQSSDPNKPNNGPCCG